MWSLQAHAVLYVYQGQEALQDPVYEHLPDQSLSIPPSRIMKGLRFCSPDSVAV